MTSISTTSASAALCTAAQLLLERRPEVVDANREDVAAARASGASGAALDRLRLTPDRIDEAAARLRAVAALPSPVGEVTERWTRPNGLLIEKVRAPLGVVAVIYENRPEVTSDAFGLCLKSGNAALLRGSAEAIRSNIAIGGVLRQALLKKGIPQDALVFVEDTSHEAAIELMRLGDYVDCLIPRGGPSLIASIIDHATVPYVMDGIGNCHVYVDASADLDDALAIVVNAKTQRPSVCNAAESLLVHEAVAPQFLPRLANALAGVELVGDARRFAREVDAGAVMVNASTRLYEGGQFGFGAEIGMSTQKLHA